MFRRPVTVLVALTALACLLPASPARAQDTPEPSAENRALATALFKEGRRLMEAGDVPAACRKLEESQRLDPGGGTLLNLAACHEKEGRTASAWTEFSAALAQARTDGRADRIAVAQERVAALEGRLRRLTLVVPPAADRPDLEITIDGVAVRRPAWGVAVPIDPGEHAVQARAAGFAPWRSSVSVEADGQSQELDVPALEALPPAPPGPVPTSAPAGERPPSAPARETPARPWLRDSLMVGAAAVGLAGIASGAYFGLHAISLENSAKGSCPAGRCTDGAVSTSGSATTNADFATGAFIVGGAGLAAAAVLLFTRPHATPPSVLGMVLPGGGALQWSGRF
jgi:hypothetical protein